MSLRQLGMLAGLLWGSAGWWPAQPQSPPAPQPPAAAIRFQDVAAEVGLDFRLICGGEKKEYIHESLCGGIAVFDFDGDGWMDIFLLNGSTVEAGAGPKAPASRLYRNQGDGRFRDVTAQSGITRRGWGMGAAVGDYNNDGRPDLYLTYFDGAVLYRNEGDGVFRDVTREAGVDNGGRWGTSAAFGDYDADGHLDLYVANYVELDPANLPVFGSGPFCQYRGIPVSCGPRGLKGSRDRLYRNQGDGTFRDVSEALGIDAEAHYGLGVIWGDYNHDGRLDLYVANDSTPSLLYRNDGNGRFTEVGVLAGVAYSADGRPQAGMGVDLGDYDGDGWLDLAKTNFSDDINNLYRNEGDGSFTEHAGPSRFGPVSIPFLGFGVRFFDADNDGWKDVMVANGHVNPQVDAHEFGVRYAQRDHLFRNLGNGTFAETGESAGLNAPRVSRGLAVADFDNDGRLDALVSNLGEAPTLLRNLTRPAGNWMRIRARGTRSNRDGLGARVEIVAGGRRQVDEVRANSSYLSASDPRLHFGLGAAEKVERIVVRWPSGAVDEVSGEAAGQELTIEEGKGVVSRFVPGPRSGTER